jgi:pyruvate/2-oxoglutarate dehydrogenase complex dihydrolipoamide dehydrogenase (E3) component
MVIKALGQEKQTELLQRLVPGIQLDAAGCIEVDTNTGATNLPGIFSGGDAVSGGREVVNAVAEGKKAARGIHKMLFEENIEGPIQKTRLGSVSPPYHLGFNDPVRVEEGPKVAFGATEHSA